ncbi:SHOCT domain-containing protein [Microbacterium sp. Leaf320]|uniref:SHOCT domain-containing protein n=1 Tax=Microbacterium sp. Leaf320 TaxID=1736334 RepID=UPI0006F9DA95|nr:SHOCT domain-containing protein [Microbacterium sp. Leaf320]KQQ65341.1 hypothetical protein ASF63_15480 [Microbacterium sp. Leaf320]
MPFLRRVGRPGLLAAAARTAIVAGTATAVSGAVAHRQQQRLHPPAEPDPQPPAPPVSVSPAPGTGSDLTSRLQQLGTMHQQGLLTADEFALAKNQLLHE